MDELDPALLDEAALRESFASWPGAFEGPASEQDADMFALVDALDLDDACIPLPEAAEQDMLAMQQPDVRAPQQASKSKSRDEIRMEKIRARNREAQARYRQKSKGQAAELEGSISHIQSSITTAQARQRQLHSQHLQLTQRCSNSCAALDAMTSVTCMLPPSAAHHTPETLPAVLSPTTAAAPMATPPVTSAATPMMSTSLVATLFSKSSRLFERSAAAVPPPLTAFRYYRTVSPSQVKAFPEHLDPSEPRLVVDEYTTSSSQFNTKKMTHEFRSSEAMQCGCGVSDIAWFVTTHVNLLGHSTAGTAGVISAVEDAGAASCSEMLSFSTTFNSGPCVASFIGVFLHLSLENTLTHRAVELLKGTEPEDLIGSLATSNGDRIDSVTIASLNLRNNVVPGFQNKRRRDASGLPKATRQRPLKSTEELMTSVGLTQDLLNACCLRCGVGDLVPMRQAVRQMLTDTVKRFSGIIPLELMRQCIEQVMETHDIMLEGLAKASPASSSDSNTTPPSHQTASSDQGSQSWPPNNDPTATRPSHHAMDATHPAPNHGETSGGAGASWGQQYQKECGLHTMAVMVIMLSEMNAVLDELPAVTSQASKSQQLTTRGALLEHNSVLVHDFVFSELIACIDSTKFIFNLIMDSLVPFMGSYFQVDNMHVDLYKVLKPTHDQRARMAEIWAVWERSKRQHDGDMHAARTLLDSLPSHIPLPHEFLYHLNALLATPPCMLSGHNKIIEAYPLPFAQCPQFCTSSTAAKSALVSNLEACFFNPCSPPGHSQMNSSSRMFVARYNAQNDVHYKQASATQMTVLQDPLQLHRISLSIQDNRLEPGVRFLGQFPADMERAERAAHGLQVVQQNECDVFVEALGSQVPGVLLCGEQSMRIWAHHFMSQHVPPDFMELCQIAATQQNRRNLFAAPFR